MPGDVDPLAVLDDPVGDDLVLRARFEEDSDPVPLDGVLLYHPSPYVLEEDPDPVFLDQVILDGAVVGEDPDPGVPLIGAGAPDLESRDPRPLRPEGDGRAGSSCVDQGPSYPQKGDPFIHDQLLLIDPRLHHHRLSPRRTVDGRLDRSAGPDGQGGAVGWGRHE